MRGKACLLASLVILWACDKPPLPTTEVPLPPIEARRPVFSPNHGTPPLLHQDPPGSLDDKLDILEFNLRTLRDHNLPKARDQ